MVNSFVGWVPIGVIIDAILFGSALLAIAAARFLPEHHLSPETKGVVTVSAAIVGTLSALVVGLLISTSSASFTAKSQQVTQISADVISLDRMLRRYGPEAQDSRTLLQVIGHFARAGRHMRLHHSYGFRHWLSGTLLRLWREWHQRDPVQLQLAFKSTATKSEQ
jgi:hypothetical protein